MSVSIFWLGQAGVILKTEHGSLAVDPFCGSAKGISERLYPPFLPKNSVFVDLVLTTHAHWDHFDPETYRDYVIPKAIVGPGSCMAALERSGLEIPGIRLDRRGTLEQNGFKIRATAADHDLDSVGYLIEAEGYKLYFSGDALFTANTIIPNIDLSPDLAFVCINGKLGNMNAYEAAAFCRILRAKVGIPMHYEMIRNNTEYPKEFTNALERSGAAVKPFVLEKGREYRIEEILGE